MRPVTVPRCSLWVFQHYSNFSAKSCSRCLSSKRDCPGYGEDSPFVFRNYANVRGRKATHKEGTELPTPLSSEPPMPLCLVADLREACQHPLDEGTLEIFFRDYCIESSNRSLSRGFLDGIKSLIACTGESSDVARAAKTVALAGLGKRTKRAELMKRAEELYAQILLSFRTTLSHSYQSNTTETLMTAVLLGLYEVRIHPTRWWHPVDPKTVDSRSW